MGLINLLFNRKVTSGKDPESRPAVLMKDFSPQIQVVWT